MNKMQQLFEAAEKSFGKAQIQSEGVLYRAVRDEKQLTTPTKDETRMAMGHGLYFSDRSDGLEEYGQPYRFEVKDMSSKEVLDLDVKASSALLDLARKHGVTVEDFTHTSKKGKFVPTGEDVLWSFKKKFGMVKATKVFASAGIRATKGAGPNKGETYYCLFNGKKEVKSFSKVGKSSPKPRKTEQNPGRNVMREYVPYIVNGKRRKCLVATALKAGKCHPAYRDAWKKAYPNKKS